MRGAGAAFGPRWRWMMAELTGLARWWQPLLPPSPTPQEGPQSLARAPPPGTPDCCRGPLPTPGSQTPGPCVLALPEPSVMEATTMPTSLTQASPLGTGPSPSSPPACHPTRSLLPGQQTGRWSPVRCEAVSRPGRDKACSRMPGARGAPAGPGPPRASTACTASLPLAFARKLSRDGHHPTPGQGWEAKRRSRGSKPRELQLEGSGGPTGPRHLRDGLWRTGGLRPRDGGRRVPVAQSLTAVQGPPSAHRLPSRS